MHTHLPFFRVPLREGLVERGGPAGLILTLIVLLSLLAPPANGQARFPGSPSERAVNARLYPLDFWGPRVGFGAGAGLVVHNLGRRGSKSLLTVAPAQHEQVATLSVASGNPRRARQYVLLDARTLHTDRHWFYGLGPTSAEEARESIERSEARVRVRSGQSFLDGRLTLQPHLTVSLHRLTSLPDLSRTDLDTRSQTHLQSFSDEVGRPGPQQTGLRVGLDVLYDTRDAPGFRTTRGSLLQGSWSRYLDIGSSFVHFDQVDLDAYGYAPLAGAHRLEGRLAATVTRSRGEAPVPFYMLPTLGGQVVPGWARSRFVASDRLMASVLYRFPLAHIRDLIQLEGHMGLHAANVYEEMLSEASLNLTFDRALPSELSSVPLRPAASAGIHLGLLFRDAPSIDLAVGLSPEGLTAVRFTFTRALQTLRPPHHVAGSVR